MNFKSKLAAFAALIAVSSASFAIDLDVTTVATVDDVAALAQGEFAAAGTVGFEGNAALIVQEGASNLAYVDQTGSLNFAAIAQGTNDANLGTIWQIGDENRATIIQR